MNEFLKIPGRKSPKAKRALIAYAASALFVFLFGVIYTYFGHGVYSASMTYAFLYLLAGFIVYIPIVFIRSVPYPVSAAGCLVCFGLIMLTIYSVFVGALDIAGATATKDTLLLGTGIILLSAGILTYLAQVIRTVINRRRKDQR